MAGSTRTKNFVSIFVIGILVGSGILGIAYAQVPKIPFNETTQECIKFNESPLSLKDVFLPTNDVLDTARYLDLDQDGYSNDAEFLQFSDPTNARSTPLDHDGDGYAGPSDPCDYDATVPRLLEITIDSVSRATIKRGESFTVKVSVKDKAGLPTDVDSIKLAITRGDGFEWLSPEMEDDGALGKFKITVPIGYDAPVRLVLPWVIDVLAVQGDKVGRVDPGLTAAEGTIEVREDKRKQLVVSPHDQVSATITTSLTPGGDERQIFYENENVVVRVRPDLTESYWSTIGAGTVELFWSSTVEVPFLGTVVRIPESAVGRRMGEHGSGSTLYFETTVTQADLFPLLPFESTFPGGIFGFADVNFRAEITDDASLPNTGEATLLRHLVFGAKHVMTIDPIDTVTRVTADGNEFEVVARYQVVDEDGNAGPAPEAPATARIKITTTDTVSGATSVIIDMPAVPMSTSEPGGIKGVYRLKVDPYIGADVFEMTDPFSFKVFSPTWTVEASAGVAAGLAEDELDVDMDAAEVDGQISTDKTAYKAGLDETCGAAVSLANCPFDMEPITLKYKPLGTAAVTKTTHGDFYNDPVRAAAAPGVARYRVFTEQGVPLPMLDENGVPFVGVPPRGTMIWNGQEFVGVVQVPGVAAVIGAGTWTLQVEYADDALIANRDVTTTTVDVSRAEGISTELKPSTVSITNIFGYNTADPTQPGLAQQAGLSATKDKDPLVTNGVAVGDKTTEKRYIVVEGTAKDGSVLIKDSSGTTLATVPQTVAAVYVNFNDRPVSHETFVDDPLVVEDLPYYQRAPTFETSGTDHTWRVVFDASGGNIDDGLNFYTWPAMEADEPVPIRAFAYASPVSAEVPGIPPTDEPDDQFTPRVPAPMVYVEDDETGTFSEPDGEQIGFRWTGPPSQVVPGVRAPKLGTGDIDLFGGGQLMLAQTNQNITWLTSFVDNRDILFSEIYVVRVSFRACDLRGGDEWCVDRYYQHDAAPYDPGTVSNTNPTGLTDVVEFQPMTLDASTQTTPISRFKVNLWGPYTESTASPSNSERYWVRVHGINEDGYHIETTTPTLYDETGLQFTSTAPTADQLSVTAATIPGFDGHQFTWIPHDQDVLAMDLWKARTDPKTAPIKETWEQGDPSLTPNDATRAAANPIRGYVAGDELVLSGLAAMDPKGTRDRFTSVKFTVTEFQGNDVVAVMFESGDPRIVVSTTAVDAAGNPSTTGPNLKWDATIDVSGFAEQVGVLFNTRSINVAVEATSLHSLKQTDSKNFRIDRNAPPAAEMDSIIVDTLTGNIRTLAGSTDKNNAPDVEGFVKFNLAGFDLDGVGSADARALDGFEIAYSHLKQEPQQQFIFFGPQEDDNFVGPPVGQYQFNSKGRNDVTFAALTSGAVGEQCALTGSNQRCWDGVVFYFPLRVGFSPLLLNLDPSKPVADQLDTENLVFGIDTGDYGEPGVIGTRGSVRPVQSAIWRDLTVHALELSLEEDEGETRPYIGFTTADPLPAGGATDNQNRMHLAISNDRAFFADVSDGNVQWRPKDIDPTAPGNPPDKWDIVECTIQGTLKDPDQGVLQGGAANLPPDQTICPYLIEYSVLAMASAWTPLTFYSAGSTPRCTAAGATYPYMDGPCHDNFDEFTGSEQDGQFEIPRGFIWIPMGPEAGFPNLAAGTVRIPLSTSGDSNLDTLYRLEEMQLPRRENNQPVPARDMKFPDGQYILSARGIDGVELFPEGTPGQPNDRGPIYDFYVDLINDLDKDGWSSAFEGKIRDQIRAVYGDPRMLNPAEKPDQVTVDRDGFGDGGIAGMEIVLPPRAGGTMKFRNSTVPLLDTPVGGFQWHTIYFDTDGVVGLSGGDPFLRFQKSGVPELVLGAPNSILIDPDGSGTSIGNERTQAISGSAGFWDGSTDVTSNKGLLAWHTLFFNTDGVAGFTADDVFIKFEKNIRHRAFVPNYRGSLFNPSSQLPTSVPVSVLDYSLPPKLVPIDPKLSTPCDWDGDGIPNDFQCQGIVDLEAVFNTDPFVPDSPMDDNNHNGIPNFRDPLQRYKWDCADGDQDHDNFCDAEEDAAGSKKDDPRSIPGDLDGDGVPDNLQVFGDSLDGVVELVKGTICEDVVGPCPHTVQVTLPASVVGVSAVWADANTAGSFTVGVTQNNQPVELVDSDDVPGTVAQIRDILEALACAQAAGPDCPHFLTITPPAGDIEHVYIDINPATRTFALGVHDSGGDKPIVSDENLGELAEIADELATLVGDTVEGTICLAAVSACPHTIHITTPAAAPAVRSLWVQIDGSGANTVATIGMNDAPLVSSTQVGAAVGTVVGLATQMVCSATGSSPGGLGVVDCALGVSKTALDPDGDGYNTDFEISSMSNPFHRNSRPGHNGAGLLLDWDGDGYTNDFELSAGGDPLHECSHPGNQKGIVVSC